MLTGEDLVACTRAAAAPDDPLSVYGLEDTPEVRAAIKRMSEFADGLPPGAVVDFPTEFPDPGTADHLYSKDMSARSLAASIYDDVDPVEKKVDATVLEAERMIALVDDVDPFTEFKRQYIRDDHGRFANVHEGGGDAYVERLGTNRHGSGYLEPSDHALAGHHLNRMVMRETYNEGYESGRAARDGAETPKVLGDKHKSMKAHRDALRRVGRERNIEGGSHAEAMLQDAGYIDGALGSKRRYRRTLTDPSTPGVGMEYLGSILGGLLSKDDWDVLTAEEKREYIRDNDGRFAHTPGSHVAIGSAVHTEHGATLDLMTGRGPKTGYIVAVQGHNREIPEDEFFAHPAKTIAAYVKANREHLAGTAKNPRMLGIWHDEKNHEVVFDVVEQHHNRDAAIQAGRDRNQQAIWDVANAAEIDTGGTGDRAVKADEAGRPHSDAGEPGGDDGRGDRRLGGDGGGEGYGESDFLLTEEKAVEEKAAEDYLTAEEKDDLRRADPNS